MAIEDVLEKYRERQEQATKEKEITMRSANDYIEEILSITYNGLQSLEEVMDTVGRGWLPMSILTTITNSMRCRLERAREKEGFDPYPF